MRARIYKPARTAMQSGTRRTRRWRLDFIPDGPLEVEPLMGWTSSSDTTRQVRLEFATLEEAVDYATRRGIEYRVDPEHTASEPKIAYSDNFRADRVAPWTH